MYKETFELLEKELLEKVRTIFLSLDNKKSVCACYDSVSSLENTNFEIGINQYEGLVYPSFKAGLYDKYVYSLNARDINGVSMADYLLTHKNFVEKRATSFQI